MSGFGKPDCGIMITMTTMNMKLRCTALCRNLWMVCVLLVWISATTTIAQPRQTLLLFEDEPQSKATISQTDAARRLAAIEANPVTPTPKTAIIRNPLRILHAHEVVIYLDAGQQVTFVRDTINVTGDDTFGWFGELAPTEGQSVGTLMLSVSGESVWGSVMINGDQWQIQALGDGVHAISHLDLTKAPQANQQITDRIHVRNTGSAIVSEDGRSEPFMSYDFPETFGSIGNPSLDIGAYVSRTIENAPPDASFCRFNYFGCPIRILVLYTDLAASEVASISDIATAGRNELAMASGRSLTGGSYEIADIVRIPFVEGMAHGDPKDRLDADLPALKSQY